MECESSPQANSFMQLTLLVSELVVWFLNVSLYSTPPRTKKKKNQTDGL